MTDDKDRSPYQEVASDLFFYAGFICLVAVICAVAGLVWGLLLRFAPKTVLMLQYLFSSTL